MDNTVNHLNGAVADYSELLPASYRAVYHAAQERWLHSAASFDRTDGEVRLEGNPFSFMSALRTVSCESADYRQLMDTFILQHHSDPLEPLRHFSAPYPLLAAGCEILIEGGYFAEADERAALERWTSYAEALMRCYDFEHTCQFCWRSGEKGWLETDSTSESVDVDLCVMLLLELEALQRILERQGGATDNVAEIKLELRELVTIITRCIDEFMTQRDLQHQPIQHILLFNLLYTATDSDVLREHLLSYAVNGYCDLQELLCTELPDSIILAVEWMLYHLNRNPRAWQYRYRTEDLSHTVRFAMQSNQLQYPAQALSLTALSLDLYAHRFSEKKQLFNRRLTAVAGSVLITGGVLAGVLCTMAFYHLFIKERKTRPELETGMGLADIYYMQGEWSKAIPLYEAISGELKSHWNPKLRLANAYLQRNHIPEAIEIYEELYANSDAPPQYRLNLGLCYLKNGDYDTARSIYREFIQQFGDLYPAASKKASDAIRIMDEMKGEKRRGGARQGGQGEEPYGKNVHSPLQ